MSEAPRMRREDRVMAWSRPKGFFPRLDEVTVYAIAIERMTGKETALPPAQGRWPALDRTKRPDARP